MKNSIHDYFFDSLKYLCTPYSMTGPKYGKRSVHLRRRQFFAFFTPPNPNCKSYNSSIVNEKEHKEIPKVNKMPLEFRVMVFY